MRQDFVHRTLASAVREIGKRFGVVLVTGPRQVGKTTLLQRIRPKGRTYVTLDDTTAKALARKDPAGFLQRYEPPVLIDEVQYAPQLFPHIKMAVDQTRKPGLFWLTGSQQFGMMRHVSESLAGRVAVVKLLGFSAFEEAGKARQAIPFLPTLRQLQRRAKATKPCSMMPLYRKIWRGSFPFAAGADWEHDLERFFSSYTATYLQRDVRDYAQIHNTTRFFTFLRMAGARSGQLVNYADFARDLGVSQPTVKSWLAVLQACGLVYLLRPYFTSRSKRLLKTPKLYFLDTGLCAHLAGWSSPRVLERGAMAGPILETYVVTEILKSYWHNGREPRIFFYRDKEKREIDVILEENGTLYPIEIKKTATPHPRDTRHFAVLDRLGVPVGPGGLVCLRQSHVPLAPNVHAVPVGYL